MSITSPRAAQPITPESHRRSGVSSYYWTGKCIRACLYISNDHIRKWRLAVGRCLETGAPLASQSTVSRLENAPHDERGFAPMHIHHVASGTPVTAILRTAKTPKGSEVRTLVKHVTRRIGKHWPATRLIWRHAKGVLSARRDSHYGRAEAMGWCEDNGSSSSVPASSSTQPASASTCRRVAPSAPCSARLRSDCCPPDHEERGSSPTNNRRTRPIDPNALHRELPSRRSHRTERPRVRAARHDARSHLMHDPG